MCVACLLQACNYVDYCLTRPHEEASIPALAALFREAMRLDSRITPETLRCCFGWPTGAKYRRSPALGDPDHFSARAFSGFFPLAYFNEEVSDMFVCMTPFNGQAGLICPASALYRLYRYQLHASRTRLQAIQGMFTSLRHCL